MSKKNIVLDLVTSMDNIEARTMLAGSMKEDVGVEEMLTSIRSAIVVSSLASNNKGADKDNALLAISTIALKDDSFKEDIVTAVNYINTHYKE